MNELQTQDGKSALAAGARSGLPQAPTALASDIIIPKLLLMQGLSELVNARKAQQGDMVKSTTAEKLGDDKTPVEVIPLTIHNVWMLQEDARGMGKWEFRGYEPRTPNNETDPWEFSKAGTKWKRTKVINLYALLPGDIDAYAKEKERFLKGVSDGDDGIDFDVDRALMPIVIPFRNTSFQAGRTVATHFTKAESLSAELGTLIPPYTKTMGLSCYQDKNDKGAYFVLDVDAKGKKTAPQHLPLAQLWYKRLVAAGHSLKVDESDTEETPASSDSSF